MVNVLLTLLLIGIASGLGAITTSWAGIFSPVRKWLGPKLRSVHPLLEVFVRCPYCQAFHYVEFFLLTSRWHPAIIGDGFTNWVLIWLACSGIALLFIGLYGQAMFIVGKMGNSVWSEMTAPYGFLSMVAKDEEAAKAK